MVLPTRLRLRFGVTTPVLRLIVFTTKGQREEDNVPRTRPIEALASYAKTKTRSQYHSGEELIQSTRLAIGDVGGIIMPNNSEIGGSKLVG